MVNYKGGWYKWARKVKALCLSKINNINVHMRLFAIIKCFKAAYFGLL